MILDRISAPSDLRSLTRAELADLAEEIRTFVVGAVSVTGGHLGSNLGVVELTLALHRVFDSPKDVLLWDTGHQAYVHKVVTGRRDRFVDLRQEGGLSGYPNRTESEHDWVENSHASTVLSYAHGLASAFALQGLSAERRVVAVVGDGALTGGMTYEALNNLGHSGRRVVMVLNDNGRSYAPTVSALSESLTHLRLNPHYVQVRERVRHLLREIPGVGELAYSGVHGLTSALREVVTPHTFFEALGVRYVGPVDGHDIDELEQVLVHAAAWDGPIVVHVLTQKGRGYAPAEEDDEQRLHDVKVQPAPGPASNGTARAAANGHGSGDPMPSGTPVVRDPDDGGTAADDRIPAASAVDGGASRARIDLPPATYTDAFTRALLRQAERHPGIVAITAAMPGPTGLLPFQAAFPDRFMDVGIAEQHAVTAAAGLALGGQRPVVAVYSTFFSRAFDQANLDVGLHGLPVVFVLDRAGITGDDGPSHHGTLDLALTLAIPGMTVFAPSSAAEVAPMLASALDLAGPSVLRLPKTPARQVPPDQVGQGMHARNVRRGDGSLCLLAVGKMVEAAEHAAAVLTDAGVEATVWDVRVVSPPDPAMLADAARHRLVLTVEDGVRHGGAGMFLADAMEAQAGAQQAFAQDATSVHTVAQHTMAPDGAESLGTASEPLPPVRFLGIPRTYLPQAKPDRLLARLGLDGPGIAKSALAFLRNDSSIASPEAL